jgi:hypothetical protein
MHTILKILMRLELHSLTTVSLTKMRKRNNHIITLLHIYHSDSMHKYSEVEIKKMLEFLIDNSYAGGGQVLQ